MLTHEEERRKQELEFAEDFQRIKKLVNEISIPMQLYFLKTQSKKNSFNIIEFK